MKYLKRAWHFIVTEPFTWVFLCFFQPTRFKKTYEKEDFLLRVARMARLALPTFLVSFPFAMLIRTIFYAFYLEQSSYYSYILNFLTATASTTALGVLLGTVLGIMLDLAWGIAGSIAGGSASGIVLSTTWDIGQGIIGGIAGSLAGSIAGSLAGIIAGGIAGIIAGRIGLGAGSGIVGGIVGGIAGGLAGGLVGGIQLGIVVGIGLGVLGGIVGGMGKGIVAGMRKGFLGNIIARIPENMEEGVRKNVVTGVAAGVQVGLQIGIMGGIALGIVGGIAQVLGPGLFALGGKSPGGFDIIRGIGIGITWGIVWGTNLGTALGIAWGLAGGIALGMAGGIALGIALIIAGIIPGSVAIGLKGGIALGATGCIGFIVSYIVGYYRLTLYPISAISGLKTYLVSKKNPPHVFDNLHKSSLYWDECVFLPLPRLKQTLLLAADQDAEHTLEELRFILAERPQQIRAAQEVSLEIAIHDLEMRESLQDIAKATQRLAEILPQETRLMNPRWATLFVRLNDASRDAAYYCNPIGWQARQNALKEMLATLKKVHSITVFRDAKLNEHLGKILNTWRLAAQQGQEELEKAPEKTGYISNPYTPGPALELRDSLFVGRRDLVQQLGEALSKGSRRPTFLLNGERRMGKSSTLKQLPDLLGAHYLPICFDLQNRGISSSTAAFLSTIAEGIRKAMSARGMPTRTLLYDQLKEASRENEAAVYRLFDPWLRNVERTLEKENRTVLLGFDEFEKLEEAGRNGYFDMRLLLDWFRSVIQNYSNIALLFSGTRTLSDLGANWAGYFVNVQVLKVSFLRPSEARQLITRPVPDFPGEQIFSEGVVEEIMRVTGCHPFIVQAICSALIDAMNAYKRNHIELPDVVKAMQRVLKNWGSTYFQDLWERTDEEQRTCLMTLRSLDRADLLSIEQHGNLDPATARRTLETLIERDLVLLEDNGYRIAAPIFTEWVARRSYQG